MHVIESSAREQPGGVRRPSVLVWLRLASVFQKVYRASAENLRMWDLSVAQFDVLAHVGAADGMTQRELAERLLVTKGNVTQLLDRMERAGLLARRQDGRANRICLTDEGRRLYEAVVPPHEEFIAGRFTSLSADDQAQLLGLLRKLDQALAQ